MRWLSPRRRWASVLRDERHYERIAQAIRADAEAAGGLVRERVYLSRCGGCALSPCRYDWNRRGLARSESPWVVGRSSCDASSAVWWQVSTWGPHCHGRRLSLHIAQNHPFIDGNKRVAVMAALVFLHVNGIEKLPAPEALEITTRQVAAGAE